MLEEISLEHEAAFLRLIDDYLRNDPNALDFVFGDHEPWDSTRFRKYVKDSEKLKFDWRPPANKTSTTRYIYRSANGDILALGFMRFPLDEEIEETGGNLCCAVSPSLRGRGYGSYCLALMLFEAVRAGLRRVFLTCPENDKAMRKVIEKNRGVLEGVSKKRAQYWISFS